MAPHEEWSLASGARSCLVIRTSGHGRRPVTEQSSLSRLYRDLSGLSGLLREAIESDAPDAAAQPAIDIAALATTHGEFAVAGAAYRLLYEVRSEAQPNECIEFLSRLDFAISELAIRGGGERP